jgi:hypothetical protein
MPYVVPTTEEWGDSSQGVSACQRTVSKKRTRKRRATPTMPSAHRRTAHRLIQCHGATHSCARSCAWHALRTARTAHGTHCARHALRTARTAHGTHCARHALRTARTAHRLGATKAHMIPCTHPGEHKVAPGRRAFPGRQPRQARNRVKQTRREHAPKRDTRQSHAPQTAPAPGPQGGSHGQGLSTRRTRAQGQAGG